MNAAPDNVLSQTESVCPVCLTRIPASRLARGDDVYLVKNCPEHGHFQIVIWRGSPSFSSWQRPKIPAFPNKPFAAVDRGCPFDCGLCPDHRQESCCVLLDVTARCDLHCNVCFADAGNKPVPDPDIKTIEGWYRRLLDAGGPYNIQLSGGEPCVRDDLPEIAALGRSLGFTFFQVNTNGLRLAREPAFARRLKDAGVSTVFLQFDGMRDDIYAALRGRPLLDDKRRAIENSVAAELGVVLVPTLVPGVNTDDIGEILQYALRFAPGVRGVHFQPVSYLGRYPQAPRDEQRITIPEVIRAIQAQTGGRFDRRDFQPPGGENAWCSFHGNFVVMPDGKLVPLARRPAATAACCTPAPAQTGAARSRAFVARNWAARGPAIPLEPKAPGPSLGGWDLFLERSRTHLFCVSGMAFQDAWNLDLERLRDCYIHHVSPAGQIVPFCAYNLTDAAGRPLYRQRGDR